MALVMTSLLTALLITGSLWYGYAVVECDFNDGKLCEGWSQGVDTIIDEFDWSVGFSKGHLEESGSNSTNVTTIGDYFLYMATTDQSPYDRAVFATPVMASSVGQVNLTFLFCMFGDHTQSLSVFVKDMSLVSSESEIWSRDGKNADEWTAVHKTANVTGPFIVIFQGKMGKGSAAIAMDDIRVENADIINKEKYGMTLNSSSTETAVSTTGETTPDVIHHDVTTPRPTTTTISIFDQETIPLIIAACGGVVFWLGVLLIITYFTCRKSRKAKKRVKRANDTLTRKLAKANKELEVNYAPRRADEVKIYCVADPPGVKTEHVYNNQIPCLYNYDPLTCETDRYAPCSSGHDYDTIT